MKFASIARRAESPLRRRKRRRRRRRANRAKALVIMWNELEQNELTERTEAAAPAAPVVAALHPSIVLSQRCAAALRAYLAEADLDHYRIFFSNDHELW